MKSAISVKHCYNVCHSVLFFETLLRELNLCLQSFLFDACAVS